LARRLSIVGIATVLGVLVPAAARAQPEVTSTLALGGGALLTDDPAVQGAHDATSWVVRFGASSSVTFLRETNRDVGLGLYAELMTSSFRDVMPGLGLTLLLPVHHGAPIVLWTGVHYVYDGTHAGGVGGRLWWGAHNHNHYRVYNTTIGIWVEVRANLFGNDDILVAAGVDIDLHVLATPWLWLASWLRGPGRL
jgi:hypothetical protein